MTLGTNFGVQIPGPSEASPRVRKAIQQIVTYLGLLSSPTFASITADEINVTDINVSGTATLDVLSLVSLYVNATVVTGTATITTGTAYEGDTTGGSFTLTLPALAGTGRVLLISCSGSNTLTVDGDGAEVINGDTSIDLRSDESIILVDFGSEWRVM